MKTYRLATMGGDAGRWMPSIDEAKARFEQQVMEGWEMHRDDGDPAPVITYETSTEDECGTVPEYTLIIVDGRWDASIFVERPCWPSRAMEFCPGETKSPPLMMVLENRTHRSCLHLILACTSSRDDDGRDVPLITCHGCGAMWRTQADL